MEMPSWDTVQSWTARLAGVAGALVSMRFLSGTISSRLVMAAGGAMFAFFASPYVSEKLSLPEGLTGFLLGLFGMSILSRVWEWIQSTTFMDVIGHILRIPPKNPPK